MILQTNTINLQHFKPFENQKVWAISNADKIPIQSSGKPSRVNDPSNWVSLEGVLQYTNTHQNCLPAVILNDQLNLIFLDLDDVIDPLIPETEFIEQVVHYPVIDLGKVLQSKISSALMLYYEIKENPKSHHIKRFTMFGGRRCTRLSRCKKHYPSDLLPFLNQNLEIQKNFLIFNL